MSKPVKLFCLQSFAGAMLLNFFISIVAFAETQPRQLDDFLKGLETLSAEFQQTLLNQYGEPVDVSSGWLYLRRPGMFHWAYQRPYEQLLISDGVSLWVYDKDLEQVSIRDISLIIEDSPAAILGGDLDIDKHYIVIEDEPSADTEWLELTPRDPESQYRAIRLGFVQGQLQSMLLLDSFGQTTQIILRQLQRNIPLDKELFEFSPPAGVDIIDSRE